MTNTQKLNGTVALVTGASSGIGEATALALADQGASVAIAARRKDRIDALAARIAGAGGTALAIEADVSSQEQAQALVDKAVGDLGRLDTLINNASVMLLGPAVGAPLVSHNRPEIREAVAAGDDFEKMVPEDIADAIAFVVTRPWRVAINEVLIRPTEQER
jgi:NADP-dependent 3-hydroxy acid dehydrogenase YdfG